MAIPTSCCLNLSPPRFCSSATKAASSFRSEDWRSRCVVAAVACMVVIGAETGDSNSTAMARESQLNIITVESKLLGNADRMLRRVPRWSDKRFCDPWNLNSLETIVPEDLPRPAAAHRRWEAVGHSYNHHHPPPPLATAAAEDALVRGFRKGCFSL